MQISLTSPTQSSSHKKQYISMRGFTLPELLISVAIIGVVTTIILIRHSSFESVVLAKGEAYEIALALREAQVRSVSALRNGSSTNAFNFPYGVSFTPIITGNNDGKSYVAFRYKSATGTPWYDSSGIAESIATSSLEGLLRISNVCFTYAIGTSDNCNLSRLDLSFRRPNFDIIFYGDNGGAPVATTTVTGVKIKVNSGSGTNTFVVMVSQFGQISVIKE